MLMAVSQLLLTACAWPLAPDAAWGRLDWLVNSEPSSLFLCDPLDGLRVNETMQELAEVPFLQSSKSLGSWQSQDLLDTMLVMEVWMTPPSGEAHDDNHHEPEPILTLGKPALEAPIGLDASNISSQGSSFDYCDGSLALELSTYRGHLLVRFRNDDSSSSACNTLYLSQVDLVAEDILQFILVFDYDTGQLSNLLSVYMNGQALYERVLVDSSAASQSLVQSWPADSVLWLFGNPIHTRPFRGALAQVSVYTGRLDDEQGTRDWVQQRFQLGVTRAKPLELQSVPVQRVAIDQDAKDPTDIIVAATTASTRQFQISVEQLSVPGHGTLYADNKVGSEETLFPALADGTVLGLGMSNGNQTAKLALKYVLDGTDYFNEPSMNAHGDQLQLLPETFAYRLVARDALGRKLAVSPTVSQSIIVLHVNHPPTLSGPEEIDPSFIHDGTATVTGIVLIDASDFDIDRVRVDVWAESGYVSIAPQHVPLADFDSCRGRSYSPWQCTGDGQRNRKMTFLAIPNDVNQVLDGLTYHAMAPGVSDDIVVRVSDGQDGDCLAAEEHEQYTDAYGRSVTTSHRGCFQIQVQIHVPAIDFDSGQDVAATDHAFLGTRINTARLLFWTLVFALGVCCWSCFRRCPRCLARGRKVEVDGDDDASEYDDEDSEIGSRASF